MKCALEYSAKGKVMNKIAISFTFLCVAAFSCLSWPVAAENAWPTYQGNASHDGYVPVSFDTTKFSLGWQKLVGNGSALNPVVSGDGKVYATVYGYFSSPWFLCWMYKWHHLVE